MAVRPSLFGVTVKIHAIAAATAALAILAACGGSESSTSTQRTKNGALTNNNNNNIIINNNNNNIGGCGTGGLCKPGDVTQSGGIIFRVDYASKTNEPTGWIEAASKNFDFPGEAGPLCTNPSTKDWSAEAFPANGSDDTNTLANKCELSPAMSLVEGAEPGTYIPSLGELSLLSKVLKANGKPLPAAKCYWTSTSAPSTDGEVAARVISIDATGSPSEGTRDVTQPCALRTVKVVKSLQNNKIDNNINNMTTIPNNNISNITNLPMPATSTPATMPPPQSIASVPMTIPPATAGSVTTMPSAITTPIKPAAVGSCATGGACKVGDIGPGGGTVFYVENSPQAWGQYYEVSPQTLDPRFDMMWCDQPAKIITNDTSIPDQFRAISEGQAAGCKKGVLRLATDYVNNGLDDWYLPSLAQVKQMYLQRASLKIEGQWLYTTDLGTLEGKPAPIAFYFVDGQIKPMNYLAGFAARAVRSFGPKLKTCATGGTCVVGDTGPAGGKVFYVANAPQTWGQYLEVSPQTLDPRFDMMWCENPPKPLATDATAADPARLLSETFAKSCTKGVLRLATDLVVNKFDDWYLPTLAQVKQLYLNRAKIQIEGQWLYTTDLGTLDGKPAPIAFYFVDGQIKPMNYLAGFAARAVRSFGPSIGTTPNIQQVPTTMPIALTTVPRSVSSVPNVPTTKPAPPTTKPAPQIQTIPPTIKSTASSIFVPTTAKPVVTTPITLLAGGPVSGSSPTQGKSITPTTMRPVTTTKPAPPTTLKKPTTTTIKK